MLLDRVLSRSWARGALLTTPLVAMVVLFIVTGVRGVDFGHHWDEVEWQIQPVREMVSTGIFMPRAAIYPSVSKWLTLMPTLPVALRAGFKTQPNEKVDPRKIQSAMLAKVDRPDFLLTVRRLYVIFSALAIIFTWAAVLALRRPWWEATIAAAGLACSWEYAYHARWVATDCLVVTFSALTMFTLALFFRERRVGWLYASAVAAGLGTGAKYPGVVLLVPVLVAGVVTLPIREVRRQLLRFAALSGVAFAAYLITTPGTLLDPFTFVEQYRWIARQYETGHYGYSVTGPFHHLGLALKYLSVSYFSPYRPLAVVLFASSLVGGVFIVRADRRLGAVLVCFPVAFLAFFCGRYKAMIARNYLLVVPFLAAFAARGLGELAARLPRRSLRWTFAGAVTATFVVGAAWLVSAVGTIRHVDHDADVRAAVAYVGQHPGTRFKLSPQVMAAAQRQKLEIPPNARAESGAEQVVFFARAEGPDPRGWKTNDPWLTKAVFGPREMNFNWYASWDGHDRVLVMTTEKARSMEISFAK
jgi:hypothetical protein